MFIQKEITTNTFLFSIIMYFYSFKYNKYNLKKIYLIKNKCSVLLLKVFVGSRFCLILFIINKKHLAVRFDPDFLCPSYYYVLFKDTKLKTP